jgi:putative FmdB family regulatory protein
VPTYQYACTECGDRSEVVQRFTDDPLTVCTACGGKLRKVFSPVGIVFKGSGFYRTDSRNGSSAVGVGKDSAGKDASASGSNGSSESSGSSNGDGSKSSSSGSGGDAGGSKSASSAGGDKKSGDKKSGDKKSTAVGASSTAS